MSRYNLERPVHWLNEKFFSKREYILQVADYDDSGILKRRMRLVEMIHRWYFPIFIASHFTSLAVGFIFISLLISELEQRTSLNIVLFELYSILLL